MTRSIIIQAALVLLLGINHTASAEAQPHEAIIKAVKAFVTNEFADPGFRDFSVSVDPPDPRLRLARCTKPLDTYMLNPNARTLRPVVGVRCRGEKRWSIFLTARITAKKQVVVAASTLTRSQVLRPGDLELDYRSVSNLRRGYTDNPARFIGKSLTRNLEPGSVLLPTMVRQTDLINRGDRVTLISGSGGFSVAVTGEAQQNGSRGERIRVRNLSSGKIVEGTVESSGKVRIR